MDYDYSYKSFRELILEFSFQFVQMILTVKNSILVKTENAVSYLRNIKNPKFVKLSNDS